MTTVTGHGIFGHSKDQTSKSLIRCNQEMYYNFRCDITGTGNRSLTQNWLVMVLKYVIKRWT